ncbi:MAG: DNA recombination/repair protein RecA, partial [Carnobacterium sp.]
DIMYGEGISQVGELVDMGSEKDIIDKSGAWYSYEGERIGQGRENAKKYFIDHPELRAEIEEKVRAAYGIGDAPAEPVESAKPEEIKEAKATVKKKIAPEEI